MLIKLVLYKYLKKGKLYKATTIKRINLMNNKSIYIPL